MNWDVAALVFAVSGAIISMTGTLMMAHAYHANGIRGYLTTLKDVAIQLFAHGFSFALNYWKVQAALGKMNEERRPYSLAGLSLIFLGFLLQCLGSVCSYLA